MNPDSHAPIGKYRHLKQKTMTLVLASSYGVKGCQADSMYLYVLIKSFSYIRASPKVRRCGEQHSTKLFRRISGLYWDLGCILESRGIVENLLKLKVRHISGNSAEWNDWRPLLLEVSVVRCPPLPENSSACAHESLVWVLVRFIMDSYDRTDLLLCTEGLGGLLKLEAEDGSEAVPVYHLGPDALGTFRL